MDKNAQQQFVDRFMVDCGDDEVHKKPDFKQYLLRQVYKKIASDRYRLCNFIYSLVRSNNCDIAHMVQYTPVKYKHFRSVKDWFCFYCRFWNFRQTSMLGSFKSGRFLAEKSMTSSRSLNTTLNNWLRQNRKLLINTSKFLWALYSNVSTVILKWSTNQNTDRTVNARLHNTNKYFHCIALHLFRLYGRFCNHAPCGSTSKIASRWWTSRTPCGFASGSFGACLFLHYWLPRSHISKSEREWNCWLESYYWNYTFLQRHSTLVGEKMASEWMWSRCKTLCASRETNQVTCNDTTTGTRQSIH